MKIKALLTLTFITLQSSHAGQVSYSWLHPVSVLSYFPQTGGKSTFHGLTYRWQSSLTPGCHLSAILVILNQPSSAKVITGKHLVCTHTIWHAKAVQEFSFAIHLVRIWFPISFCNASCREISMGDRKHGAGTNIFSLLSKNYTPRFGDLGSVYNHKEKRKAKLPILSPSMK